MHVRDPLDLLPLRQLVTATSDASAAFARQVLLDRLSKPQRYLIVRHGSGGQILAAGERALAEAQTVLQQAYGAAIAFGGAAVHTYRDVHSGTPMVPIIFVRIDAPRAHAQELLQLLKERDARIGEVNTQRDRIVIRADLELPRALELERSIGWLTDGAAQVLSWLLRYAPAKHVERRENGTLA